MSLDCIQFSSPADIHVERIHARTLQIQLQFPGLRRFHRSRSRQRPRRGGLFSCFGSSSSSSKSPRNRKKPIWGKLIDDKTPASVTRSGEWVPTPGDKKLANSEIWLRVFRRRISVMVIPLKSDANRAQTRENPRREQSEMPPVTLYYYWDSGRLNRGINLKKSQILIEDDRVSIKLESKNENWTKEDVDKLKNGNQKTDALDEKVKESVPIGKMKRQGDTVETELPKEGTSDLGTRPHSEQVNVEKQISNTETIPMVTPNSLKNQTIDSVTQNLENVDLKNPINEDIVEDGTPLEIPVEGDCHETLSIPDLAAQSTKAETATETVTLEKADASILEIPQVTEKSTSCTDIVRELADAATATMTPRGGDVRIPDGCYYCSSVREQVGKAEFKALQARVEAMNKDEWARVLDIIVGKTSSSRRENRTPARSVKGDGSPIQAVNRAPTGANRARGDAVVRNGTTRVK